MPRFDGIGPQGKGPMSGRGLGNCTGATTNPTLQQSFFGLRLGLGRRRRNGNRRGFGRIYK